MQLLKRIAARLPHRYQQELKRLHFGRQIRKGLFQRAIENDREFGRLHEWVRPGDWVVDVGANVGNYAARLSELVEASGRVLAIEPVPQTFELLAANAGKFRHGNVSLLNFAASEAFAVRSMQMPALDSGAPNPYMAHLADDGEFSVLCMPVDSIGIARPIRLVKIDVEGHELEAIRGMRELLARDHPILIVEGRSPEVAEFLSGLGYVLEAESRSPNRVFLPAGAPSA